MNSHSQFWNKSSQVRHGERPAVVTIGERLRHGSEYLWLGVTFTLFLFLGPFAAIAVIPAIFSLASSQDDGPEPTATAGGRE